MYSLYLNIFVLSIMLDVVVAATFTSFAVLYRHKDDDAVPVQRAIVIALITVSCLVNLSEFVVISVSKLR